MRTPTSRAGSRPGRGEESVGQDGFTLLEVLAVLVIMGLALATVTLSVSRRGDRMSVSALAAETATRARATRNLALETGRDATLWIDLGRRSISSPIKRAPLPIPADVSVEVVASIAEQGGAAVSGIRFFPDGASTGGTIRLGQAGSMHEVRINWFTGRVQVVQP